MAGWIKIYDDEHLVKTLDQLRDLIPQGGKARYERWVPRWVKDATETWRSSFGPSHTNGMNETLSLKEYLILIQGNEVPSEE